MSIISLRQVSFRYPKQDAPALSNVSLDIFPGELLALIGGDRAGKTTLCHLLNGLIPNLIRGELAGEIIIDGRPSSSYPQGGISRIVGLSLQDPESQLFTATVEEEVAFGPENLSVSPEEIDRRVTWALEVMGIADLRGKSPSALSGGQKQRLAIASVLSMLPKVIVLDEPLGMLDPRGRRELIEILAGLAKEKRVSVVISESRIDDFIETCDKVAILNNGSLLSYGPPLETIPPSDKLKANGITPPQIQLLSELMIEEDMISPDRAFLGKRRASDILRALIGRENGGIR